MVTRTFTYLLVSAISAVAFAETDFSAFATLAAGSAFGSDNVHTQGYDQDVSLAPNTFLGLQMFSDVMGDLDAVVQVTADAEDGWGDSDNLNLDLSWAFLSYDLTDSWRITAGRQRMPHYTYSDFLTVSYAYHWIQAPSQLYNAPFNSFNGISMLNTFSIDDARLTAQLLYGAEPDYEDDMNKEYSDIWGGKFTLNYEWLTLTAAYFEFEESTVSERTSGAGSGPGPGPGPAPEPEQAEIKGVLTSWDFGIQADLGSWLIVAEVTSVDLSALGERYGTRQPIMISAAKSIGDFTPHATFGYNRELNFNSQDSITPFCTLGLRWYFRNSMALKVELSGAEDNTGDTGYSFEMALVAALF